MREKLIVLNLHQFFIVDLGRPQVVVGRLTLLVLDAHWPTLSLHYLFLAVKLASEVVHHAEVKLLLGIVSNEHILKIAHRSVLHALLLLEHARSGALPAKHAS